jgi:excisionase family DNA binding protein
MEKRVFTLDEVAKIFRVNPRTIFRLIHGQNEAGKKLPATKIGRSWRITEDNLKTFLLENANIRSKLEFKQVTEIVREPKKKK